MTKFLTNYKPTTNCLKMHLKMLRLLGLWPPETNNKFLLKIYSFYSHCFRWFFLYLYTFTQIMYFTTVTDLEQVSDASFLLMTQIALCIKVKNFQNNIKRIHECVYRLDSNLYHPVNPDEAIVVNIAKQRSIKLNLSFLITAQLTILGWAIFPLIDDDEPRLPLSAWYPFNTNTTKNFILTYLYQIIGIFISSWYNVATDTLGSSLMAHCNAQIQRLGIQLTQLGWPKKISFAKNHFKKTKNKILRQVIQKFNDELQETENKIKIIKEQHGDCYSKVIRCILFHKELLRYASEIEDIYKRPIFVQLICSIIIICMTGFQLVIVSPSSVRFISMVWYLITMIVQIFLFCWMGNEINYSSGELTQKAYFCNFHIFNRSTSNALIYFMQRTLHNINVRAGDTFKLSLNLSTFVGIMKSSYSYFAVLQTMQNK